MKFEPSQTPHEAGMHTLRQLECAIVKGNIKKAPAITRKCLLEGLPPHAIIENGILKGLDTVGRKWKTYEYFIPNVLVSAMATKLCIEALHPALISTHSRPLGKAVAGTVRGDVHDIGKNIVLMFMEASGFLVDRPGNRRRPGTLRQSGQTRETRPPPALVSVHGDHARHGGHHHCAAEGRAQGKIENHRRRGPDHARVCRPASVRTATGWTRWTGSNRPGTL